MIAGDVAVLADDTVARHHEANRVLANSGTYRTGGLRRPGFGGEVGIGGEPADRNGQQFSHAHFKIRSDHHDAKRLIPSP